MKKIILANIGNRNLQYRGETIVPAFPNFREKTRQLLEAYENVKADLDEQILSNLFHDPEKGFVVTDIDRVILFASDQVQEQKTDQDTVYEARILEKLLHERYGLRVEVRVNQGRVTDNDGLLRYYRQTLTDLRDENPGQTFLVCDAGGTAQQKAALKIAAEYVLGPERFEVRYVNPGGRIEVVERVEYRRIIDEEQVAALVRQGQYAGALALYEALPGAQPDIVTLLRMGLLRFDFLWNSAQECVRKEWRDAPERSFLYDYKRNSLQSEYEEAFKSIFKKGNTFFKIAERFEIADFYAQVGQYSQAVLGYSIFVETFVNALITQTSEYDLVGRYNECSKKLADSVWHRPDSTTWQFFEALCREKSVSFEIKTGLPLHLMVARHELTYPEAGRIQDLLDLFIRMNSVTNQTGKGIDALRNDMAHKGLGVTKATLEKSVPDFAEILQQSRRLLGLPPENSFARLGHFVIRELRR